MALSTRSGCAARTTSRTRWRRAARDARPRRRSGGGAGGAAHASRASRTGSRRSRRIDGVLYVDDSKATNVASAVVGIRSFPGGVHAILGGRGKGEDYAPLAAAVAERCRAAYLVGEEAGAARPRRSRPPASRCTTAATSSAPSPPRARRGPPGDVVLLSPACASYDQYRSFERARRPLQGARAAPAARRG